MTERNIFRGVNSIKFNQRFKDDNDCLEYLAEVKWQYGYKCKRCENDKFGNGNIFITEDVLNVDMTKVQRLEQCLRNLNFQY